MEPVVSMQGVNNPSITISRQLGSLGCAIAAAVKERLGYRLAWRDMINEAGRRAGTPELALDCIDELGLFGMQASTKTRASYKRSMEEVIRELASEGNVIIIGRAGQAILRGFPNMLHVRVVAPRKLRAERIAKQHGIPIAGAIAQVEASDRNRRMYLKRFYNVRWDDPDLYDLIINTEYIDLETAALLITQAVTGIISGGKTHASSGRESSI